MTETEARNWLKNKMGNDYYFLPKEAEDKWIEQLVNGTFFKEKEEFSNGGWSNGKWSNGDWS